MFASDGALIDAPPGEVYRAILDEYSGVTQWWKPYSEQKLRGTIPIDHEGAIVDLTIRSERAKGTPRFSYTLTKMVEGELIDVRVDGDIVGTGEWTFEPVDGKTRVTFKWDVKPRRLFYRMVSPFVDMSKIHSEVMQYGFKALSSYLGKNKDQPALDQWHTP